MSSTYLSYTQPSDLATLVPHNLAAELRREIEAALNWLPRIPEPLVAHPMKPGGWSAKQVIGHLIDSATNNHQRFVRLQLEPELRLAGYAQESWVSIQRYDLCGWNELLETWRVFNLHLAHVVEHIDPIHLPRPWHSANGPIPLGFLIEDYIAHLRHHLLQLPAFED
jgi:hypothetical protein